MKHLLLLILAFPFENCFSQDTTGCFKYITIDEDKFTDKKIVSGKDIVVKSPTNEATGFRIIVMVAGRKQDALIINMTVTGMNCIDKGDMAYFLCDDGTKFTMAHASSFNCQGDFAFYFGGVFGKSKELEYFSTKKIKAVRFTNTSKVLDFDVPDEDSNAFSHQVKCLLNYMNR